MIVWKRGSRDVPRASRRADGSEDAVRSNQASLSERVDAVAHRRRESASCWDQYVAMSRLQTEGTRPYRVRPRMMPDNRPPSSTRTVETAQPERTRPPNAGAGAVPDYYALLGVERNAPRERLERLYRQYVARLHPDKFFNDARRRDLAQEKLKELNTAIKVLRDPDQRARYDSLLAGDRRPATPLLSRLAGATRS